MAARSGFTGQPNGLRSARTGMSLRRTALCALLLAAISGTAHAVNISTNNLPDGTVGLAYSVQLQATAGTTPFVWSVVADVLPPGLALSSAGRISGTPTTAGNYAFTVRVVDAQPGT